MHGREGEMTAKEPKFEAQGNSALGGLLYRLTVIFPSWAGAFLALYALRARFR